LLPTYQLDLLTKQRLKFARYLIQRGTFNEGFEATQLPTYYGAFEDYSDDDPFPHEKYLRDEYA
jgi:hypothetical protein